MAGSASVIDAVVALEALFPVHHAIEHPGIGVIVDASFAPRYADHGVDDETVVRIDIEPEILASFGRGPIDRMGSDALIHHQAFEQRLCTLHARAVLTFLGPHAAQIADEALKDGEKLL